MNLRLIQYKINLKLILNYERKQLVKKVYMLKYKKIRKQHKIRYSIPGVYTREIDV